jgi:sulfur transfer complex TusBCD TusB component (DsrH family)
VAFIGVMMAEQLERIQIIERLTDLVSTKSTGTFSIITASTHLAVLLFNNGVIISLIYSHFRGMKALEKIEQIDSGMCSFKTTVLGIAQKDIPTTREVIHRLEISSTQTAETTRNTLNGSEIMLVSHAVEMLRKSLEVAMKHMKKLKMK